MTTGIQTELPATIPLSDTDALRLENITLAKALIESRFREAQQVYQSTMATVSAQHGKWAAEFAAEERPQLINAQDLVHYDFDIEKKIARLKAADVQPA